MATTKAIGHMPRTKPFAILKTPCRHNSLWPMWTIKGQGPWSSPAIAIHKICKMLTLIHGTGLFGCQISLMHPLCCPYSHFGWLKFIFVHISRHFRSKHNFNFFKWPPAAILDGRNSLSFAFFTISDQNKIFIFFQNVTTRGATIAICPLCILFVALIAILDGWN